MNTHKTSRYLLILLAIVMLSAACQPAAATSGPQPTQPPVQRSATPVTPSATQPFPATQTVQPTKPSTQVSAGISLDFAAVAKNVSVETLAAQPAGPDAPFWEGAPQYRLLTLQGYPVTDHVRKPQIFIYPVSELAAANKTAGKFADDLKTLLQTHQAEEQIPFMPLSNLSQMIRTQMVYLDFKNGKGVSLLTQLDQGMLAVNNSKLIYAFQGLTNDGKYYISAILPVNHPDLPGSSQSSQLPAQTAADYQEYHSKMVNLLNQQPAERFTPDLKKLDALIASLEIK